MTNVKNNLIATFAVLASALTISACDSEIDGTTSFPDTIENTRWQASCVDILRGNYTQIQIAFSDKSMIIRNNLYLDENCTTLKQVGRRSNTFAYRSQGLTKSGLFHAVNFSLNAATDGSHVPYIPLVQDIYKIEAGLLYFGDPDSIVRGRPALTKNSFCCRYVDNNYNMVFDRTFSQFTVNAASVSEPVFDSSATILEGTWGSKCNNSSMQRLTFNAGRVFIDKSYFEDVDCAVLKQNVNIEGHYQIEKAILSSSGLDISALSMQYNDPHDPEAELSADTHIYVDGETLFLGLANSIDFNVPYYYQ